MLKLSRLEKKNRPSLNQTNRGQGPALLRLQKDINELSLASYCSIEFPDHNDLMNFNVTISPDKGCYNGGTFVFNFQIGTSYPHEPPRVKCVTPIYHPNIDLEGNICLNILREDWNPVLNLNSVIYGVQFLLLEPNATDPLNETAAEVLNNNPLLFQHNVKKAMQGRNVDGLYFTDCMQK